MKKEQTTGALELLRGSVLRCEQLLDSLKHISDGESQFDSSSYIDNLRLWEAKTKHLLSITTLHKDYYKVAVMGRFKAGKSSLINKLLGENLASVNTNPETAALSNFHYSDQTYVRVKYYSISQWREIQRNSSKDGSSKYQALLQFLEKYNSEEHDRKFDLQALEEEYVSENSREHYIYCNDITSKESKKQFTDQIKQLTSSKFPFHYFIEKIDVYTPASILIDNVVLTDTPGLDDPDSYRVEVTKSIVENVDAVLYLMTSGASFSKSDEDFITLMIRKQTLGQMHLVITKVDETYRAHQSDSESNGEDPLPLIDFLSIEETRLRGLILKMTQKVLNDKNLSSEYIESIIKQIQNITIHFTSTRSIEDKKCFGIEEFQNFLIKSVKQSERFMSEHNKIESHISQTLEWLSSSYSRRLKSLSTSDIEKDVMLKLREERKTVHNINNLLHEEHNDNENNIELHHAIEIDKKNIIHTAHLELQKIKANEMCIHWRSKRAGNFGYFFEYSKILIDSLSIKLNDTMKSRQVGLSIIQKNIQKVKSIFFSNKTIQSYDGIIDLQYLFEILEREFAQECELSLRILGNSMSMAIETYFKSSIDDIFSECKDRISEVFGTGTTIMQNDIVRNLFDNLIIPQVEQKLQDTLDKEFMYLISNFENSLSKTLEQAVIKFINEFNLRFEELTQREKQELSKQLETNKIFCTEIIKFVKKFEVLDSKNLSTTTFSEGSLSFTGYESSVVSY